VRCEINAATHVKRSNTYKAQKFHRSGNLRAAEQAEGFASCWNTTALTMAAIADFTAEETSTMLKKLMITTASLALLTSATLAQTPDQTQPAPPAATAAKGQVITEQKPDQMLASKLKGTDVIGSNNEKIGDVNDMLFDKDGKILAYVVGVGGFLGIGAKDVALSPASFQIVPASERESMKLKLSMTKDELKTAADFKPYKEATSPTGQAPSRDRAPMTPPSQR
jgi:sporulation protein YlmC with PRC-barrel domain